LENDKLYFKKVSELSLENPATKIMWIPGANQKEILATSSECLKIWTNIGSES